MNGKTLVVTSGKGGVGKTTVTANLGLALARLGSRVCLIDMDLGLRNLDLVLGVEQRIVYDLVDVARGECRLQQALIHDRRESRLYFLPAAQSVGQNAVSSADLVRLVAGLRESFDFVLIDCPAGIEAGFATAIAAADAALVIVMPEVASVRDADRVLGLLERRGLRDVQLLVNRMRPEMAERNDMIGVTDLEELLGVPAIAVLPDDPEIVVSTNRGEPVALNPHARLRRHFDQLAIAVAGQQLHVLDGIPPSGFLQRLKALFA
ncbi:MAG TPA: septum site-determining protein MinD [Oscillatoriaceae cyanobacterium]